jgi:hypothetical protein
MDFMRTPTLYEIEQRPSRSTIKELNTRHLCFLFSAGSQISCVQVSIVPCLEHSAPGGG